MRFETVSFTNARTKGEYSISSFRRKNALRISKQSLNRCNHTNIYSKSATARQQGHMSITGLATNTSASRSITEDYFAWAREAGIHAPKLTQAYFGDIRGAKALDVISPTETFVNVPLKAALVVAPKEKCPCPDYIDSGYWGTGPWSVKMAVQLLREKSLGRNSRVWGFIAQLPDTIDAPVRWSPLELAELQYQPLIDSVKKQQANWKKQYEDLCKALKSPLSYDEFIWALENVCSRAFSGPYAGSSVDDKLKTAAFVAAAAVGVVFVQHVPLEQALNGAIAALVFNLIYDAMLSKKLKWHAMIPVLDACNHSSAVDSELSFEYFQDSFTVSTNCRYDKGDEVFVSYGNKTNDGLLQYYGFIEAGNGSDTYVMTRSLGAEFGVPINVVVKSNGSFTPETLAEARKAVSRSASAGTDAQESEVRRLLVQAVEAELASKATTVADDEKALSTPHLLSSRLVRAIDFRVAKKRLLQKCIAKAMKKTSKLQSA